MRVRAIWLAGVLLAALGLALVGPAAAIGAPPPQETPTATPVGTATAEPTPTPLPAASWNPPPLQVPLARHPYDHYWLIRPVASNYINYGLSWYPYGSDGPDNDLRIHHGLDIPNPIGVEIKAAGSGTVVVAGRGFVSELETIGAYGNVIAIQHDFGYRGQAVYTLYAHLSSILVKVGDHVQAGDLIGLIGATGLVSGPHVHFEVRVGSNGYYYVRNPELWMAPYAGTGVIAGALLFSNGAPAADVSIDVIDVNTGQITRSTTSYAGFGVNPDDSWDENFVVADVPTGRYRLLATFGGTTWTGEVAVREGMTNWVDMESITISSSDG